MAAKKTTDRVFKFDLTVRGEVTAKSLEDAEEILDFATDTEELRKRRIRITARDTSVRDG